MYMAYQMAPFPVAAAPYAYMYTVVYTHVPRLRLIVWS